MTDEEALAALARGEKLHQPMLKRLSQSGFITCDDITTLDSQDRQVRCFIGFTARGTCSQGVPSKGTAGAVYLNFLLRLLRVSPP
jgi:hypothetical protein